MRLPMITQSAAVQSRHAWSVISKRRRYSERWLSSSTSPSLQPLPELRVENDDGEALAQAVRPYFDQQQPVVLRRMLMATPKNLAAMENFRLCAENQYWDKRLDSTTDCRVEMGGNYMKSQIVEIPFAQFLTYLQLFEQRFGTSLESNPGGAANPPTQDDLIYLAQNDIFPSLLQDVELSSFCLQLGEGKLYSTMIWIGPYGCVSPLHYDPLDNLLGQFVGTKNVFMCSPDSQVHAGANDNQSNTSPINPEDLEGSAEKYPSIVNDSPVSFYHATLSPGDALYLPKKWWHYIRTVETSLSINTWFR